MRNPRVILAAVAAVGCVVVVLLVALGGRDSGDRGTVAGGPTTTVTEPGAESGLPPVPARKARAGLTLERADGPGYEELLVSLPDERMNTAETNAGATMVLLTCDDRSGRQTLLQEHAWPLVVEEGFPPHVHRPARPNVLDTLRSCRLEGRGIDFSGRVEGRLPRLDQ